MRKETLHILILAFVVLLYIVFWFGASSPYRLFPSDDTRFLTRPWFGDDQFSPGFALSLNGIKQIWMVFSDNALQSLLIYNIIGNGITLLFLILIIFRLTGRIIPAALGAILFATSLWPAAYYFIAFYAAFATALSMVMLWCIVEALFNKQKARLFLSSALLFSIMYFFVSPSALPLIFLETLIVLYLLAPLLPFIKRLKRLFLILFPIFIITFLVLYSSLPGMLFIRDKLREINLMNHWLSNIYASANIHRHISEYIGYTPPIAKLGFFKIGIYYAPVIFWSFIALSVFFALIVIVKKRYTLQIKIALSLLFIIYTHAAIVDVLPFTKLGRTQFVIYPLVIISLVILIDYFSENYLKYLKYRYKQIIIGILTLIFLYAIYDNIAGINEIIRVRKYPGDVLAALTRNAKVYMLKNDSHAAFIGEWLDVRTNLVGNLKEINKEKSEENKDKIVFIIGPHGKYSGRSGMNRSKLPDFNFIPMGIEKPESAVEIKLPYYAYFPPFLFEESISQSLYFDGGSPDYKSADKQLTVWIW